ncbi:Brix-domain-containing protein [Rhizodiscina lignyota]|uniref:Brix-domain-containing protein n=1 Tax=Rhizodiscina lignyota TaxID=1504668 RepID=A0A9P4ICX4_9PEZI|nr:Brix-domain-containing protein [Rhizodiscina lignyota]
MARRRVKKHTQASVKDAQNAQKPSDQAPKSMVIRIGAGEVGSSVSQLVKDMRQVMEPHTAIRLQERKANKLRDYTTMTGPLGVTHLLLFSRSKSGNTNLRIAITPRGPTLHFRVDNYSLCKDIVQAIKHPKSSGHQSFMSPPLLVMNNFTSTTPSATANGESNKQQQIPKQLESLITTVFQSLFPPISPQTTPLTSIRRVLLLDRTPQASHKSSANGQSEANGDDTSSHPSYILNLRHYHISTKQTGLPKSIRRLNAAERAITGDKKKNGRAPNLSKMEDVADYFLGDPDGKGGYTSASESEVETDAEVEVLAPQSRKIVGKRDRNSIGAQSGADADSGSTRKPPVEKRAVKLTELGPRMKLRLTKVEEGVCAGKVLWHEFVTKTREEEKAMDEMWEGRRKEKDERKRIQKENVERKKKEKAAKGEQGDEGEEELDEDVDDMDLDDDEWDSEEHENEEVEAEEDAEEEEEMDG